MCHKAKRNIFIDIIFAKIEFYLENIFIRYNLHLTAMTNQKNMLSKATQQNLPIAKGL